MWGHTFKLHGSWFCNLGLSIRSYQHCFKTRNKEVNSKAKTNEGEKFTFQNKESKCTEAPGQEETCHVMEWRRVVQQMSRDRTLRLKPC